MSTTLTDMADIITVKDYDGRIYYNPLGEEFIKKSIHDDRIKKLEELAISIEQELACSMACFVTKNEWSTYQEGILKYRDRLIQIFEINKELN